MGQGSASSQITYSNYDFWLEYLEFERRWEELEHEWENYDNDGDD